MCPHPIGGYKVDGVKVPGVTTILGRFKDSGGLLYWAFEQAEALGDELIALWAWLKRIEEMKVKVEVGE